MTKNVAIIGCGWAGGRHAGAYRELGAVISWAVDTDRSRAEALQKTYDICSISTDYREALSDPLVEIVDICLPHNLHASVTVQAAVAGKHIICEKPIAANLAEADEMIEAAKSNRVILMIAESDRFRPLYIKIKELIDENYIGEPALVQMTRQAYLRESFLKERRWFLDAKAAAGGIMMSGGIHDFETLRTIVGEIATVHAFEVRKRFREMEGDDTSIATLLFDNGAVGVLVESFIMKSLTTASGLEVHTIRIDGELGSIEATDRQTIRIFSERDDLLIDGKAAEHIIVVPQGDSIFLEIRHFLECIDQGKEPITSGRTQRRTLELVLAAYQSMQTGYPVDVSRNSV